MKNDEAREYFKNKGLDYSVLTDNNRLRLKELIKEELDGFRNPSSPEFRMFINKGKKGHIQHKDGACCEYYLTCKGTLGAVIEDKYKRFIHFSNREAISFNRDGFIGFAGWADSKNVQPFLIAFCRWCDEVTDNN